MNPYDAILEQLRKAQRRGVETVSNRLDFVLESLEAIINEAKEAVKEAIPDEPDELFPVAECSRAVEEARKSLEASEARVEDLEAKVHALEAQVAEAESQRGGALNVEVLRRLDAARTQSELLKELLPSLLNHVGRAVVLVIREGTVSAWSGIGFENGERLRAWSAKVVESPVLEKFIHENSVVRFSPSTDELFQSWLEGEAAPSEAVIIPVVLRGRTVGGVYADRVEGAPWDVDSAQVMVAMACWLIDTLSFRTIVPSPTLQQPVDLGVKEPAAEGVETTAKAVSPEEEVTPDSGYPRVPESAEFRRETPEAVEAPAVQEPAGEQPGAEVIEPAGEPGAEEPASRWGEEPAAGTEVEAGEEPATTVQVEREGGWAAPEGAEEAPAAPAEEPEAVPPESGRETPPPVEPVTPPPSEGQAPAEMETVSPPPVSAVVPPPPVSAVVPPSPEEEPAAGEGVEERAPEEEAKHEEARRFARLLVSEIKLYNPEEVERGRANNDIYQRLKDDIDRSLEMYEKRVSEEVRTRHDYFREALIRILADGDEDALGM